MLEMILMDEVIRLECLSGRSSEDKHFIKKDKQSIMRFDSFWLQLSSILFLK